MTKKALVIDGNSLLYRFYYATLNQLEFALNHNYVPNNAIRLLTNAIIKILNNNEYTYFFVAFDHQQKSYRSQLLTSYKQNRVKTPDELYLQLVDTMDLLNALGIKSFNKPAYEADDLIGSYVNLMNKHQIHVDIISSDKDMLQLVNDLTNVLLVKKGINELDEYNINNFPTKFFNLSPKQIIDFKAIVGDSSDNIKGINGIGDKSAISLLNKYDCIENIYNHLDELTPSLKQKFINQADDVKLFKNIVTIMNDGLNDYSINDFLLANKDIDSLNKLIEKYHLTQLKNFLL